MRNQPQRGVTLIELMMVVAIIGILASAAVFGYTKYIRKGKASEVAAMFTEFRIRQEQYQIEIGNGRYLSTGTEASMWPPTPSGPDTPTLLAPIPATWQTLRMAPDKAAVYCSYVTVAGAGGDSTNLGPKANSFGMTVAPASNWYYVLAKCDFDSNASTFSWHFARSDDDGISVENGGQ